MHENARRKLTPDQNNAVEWLTIPKLHRAPETLEKLAEELGVNPSTIWRWRKKFGLDDMAMEIAKGVLFESLPDVLRALAEKAEEGSYNHIRLFLALTDGHRQKIDVTVEDCRSKIAGEPRDRLRDEED